MFDYSSLLAESYFLELSMTTSEDMLSSLISELLLFSVSFEQSLNPVSLGFRVVNSCSFYSNISSKFLSILLVCLIAEY